LNSATREEASLVGCTGVWLSYLVKRERYICPSEVKQKGVVVWLRFKKFIILAPRVCVRGWSVVSGNSCGYMDAIPAGRDVY
jgi:hypothetical protein